MTAATDRVPLGTKLAYGAGAIAYGSKENGFTVFLLLFYNQVVGLNAGVVGTVIAIALIFDAMIDPVIGVLSDRTHTRWGRRHPWLYGSALPIALAWMMLWYPPEGSDALAFGWLLLSAILARAALATNEVPSLAMAPELTRDYHERTAVLLYRYLFCWIGGLIALVAAYQVFLTPPIGAPTGPGMKTGLQAYGFATAIAMAVTVVLSALGTHRRMAKPPLKRIPPQSLRGTLNEIRQPLGNRAFVILICAGAFAHINSGLGLAISQYNLNYVWQLTPTQLTIYALSLFAGVAGIFFLITPIARSLGKVRACAMLCITSALFVCSSYTLRLLGLFPEVGDPAMLPAFLVLNTIGTALGVGALIIAGSMMSDVVEASEEKTGRREEGLFFAGTLFMQKTSSGLGIFIVGLLLAAAEFPDNAVGGQVAKDVLDRMTLYFVIATLALSAMAAIVVMRFPFGEAEHRARVAKLAVASAGSSSQGD